MSARTDIRQVDADDYESILGLLADLKDLAGEERLRMETRLAAIDRAITEAVGGIPEVARDFVRDVIIGRVDPGAVG